MLKKCVSFTGGGFIISRQKMGTGYDAGYEQEKNAEKAAKWRQKGVVIFVHTP